MDHGVRVFKAIYGELTPYLEKYVAKKLKTNIHKAITGYDEIRSKVRDVENDIEHVRHKLSHT